jgi:processive 1,2-diacylglycerol beta-glucosyltransferase
VIGINIEPFKGSSIYGYSGADQIVVFSERAKAGLVKRGVPAENVPVYDFILDSRFLKDYDSVDATRARFGLEPGRLTLLMSSGGDGIGDMEKYVRAAVARDLPVQLAVVTGRNAGLKERLEAAPPPPGSRTALRVFGFVESMSDLIHASDIVFGKSGACTTAESLYMRKPVIFYRYVTGNEKRSLDFVRDNGIGWYAPTPRRYVRIVESLLRYPETLDRIRDTYRRLDFKAGTDQFCRSVDDMLDGGGPGRTQA